MAAKGPTWKQADIEAARIECRVIAKWRTGSYRHGKSTVIITCPFCGVEVTAFKWSLAAGGKRCGCGALFGSSGNAYHWRSDTTTPEKGNT